MPGSPTTPGWPSARVGALGHIAFHYTNSSSVAGAGDVGTHEPQERPSRARARGYGLVARVRRRPVTPPPSSSLGWLGYLGGAAQPVASTPYGLDIAFAARRLR